MKGCRKFFQQIVFLGFLVLIFFPSSPHAAMQDYCLIQPFVTHGLKPNLLLMLDNSGSQYDLEYQSTGRCSTTTTKSCKVNGDCPGSEVCNIAFCYDNSYSNTTAYYGYFDPSTCYTSSGVSYAADTTTGYVPNTQFTTTSCSFSNCAYQTPYFCLGTNLNTFSASGNFLNWLTASKMDIQKWILTGGKYDTTNSVLVGESRGCVGSRYIKEAPQADYLVNSGGTYISFGIRGDISSDIRIPSTGGTTRIDIFRGNFDNADCQAAITAWTTGGGQGENSNNSSTSLCLNVTGGTSTSRTIWNHALQTCWSCAHTPCQLDDIGTGDITRIEGNNECGALTEAQMAALTPSSPMYVCLRDTTANIYLGACYYQNGNGPNGKWDDACVKQQLVNYCNGLKLGEVVDPSSGVADTSTTGNIPANLVDGGIMGELGDPIRTYHGRVSSGTAPTGVIQRFQNLVRFGALTFNDFGSTTECTTPNSMVTYTCTAPSNKDGGKIISAVGAGKCSTATSTSCTVDSDCPSGETCTPSVGDHSTGLINAIDSVKAATWTPFSEAFYEAIGYFAGRSDMLLNNGDYDPTKNPVQYNCQRNNVLFVTDGQSTADLNAKVTAQASSTHYDAQYDTAVNATCPMKYAGSRNVDDLAWLANTKKITNFGATPDYEKDKIYTYVVYSGIDNGQATQCNPKVLMSDTATRGGGNFYQATSGDATSLQKQLLLAFQDIIKRASSGTAASVLASGEGSGANLVQALFYPAKQFYNNNTSTYDSIEWIGRLLNMWYYVDPFFTYSSIREDTNTNNKLNLSNDYIVQSYFDQSSQSTKARLFQDVNGDGGTVRTLKADEPIELVKNIWEAGQVLWQRDPSTRTIYTTTNGTTLLTLPSTFPATIDSTVSTYLQASNNDEAQAIIRYVRGEDTMSGGNFATNPLTVFVPNYRNRTVTLGNCSTSTSIKCGQNSDCPSGETCGNFATKVWKLGDIVNSTPRVSSWIQMNNYDTRYNDISYSSASGGGFVNTSSYKSRGMIFAGGNDGMLHAFRLGQLELPTNPTSCTFGSGDKACLSDSANFGKEMWAFIPKNTLPYLKYLADPSYCHIYSIDLTPMVFDASIGGNPGDPRPSNGSSWRTILIGGMRFGGACKDTTYTGSDGVKIPMNGVGYSSYFALDVTNQNNPVLLWEFSDPELGFSTSGPAVIRIGSGPAQSGPDSTNGSWYVVLASGPTGPIDTTNQQFLAHSDQNLKLFVLPLSSSPGVPTPTVINTGIPNAFAGSIASSTYDANDDYQDDAIYIGYVKKAGDGTWTSGGVGRLLTKNSGPGSWEWSKVVDGTGPVVSAVSRLQDNDNHILWLYFGTGRYYYRQTAVVDDADGQRTLYGIKEPCFTSNNVIDSNCSTPASGFTNVTSVSSAPSATDANKASFKGWYVNLDDSGSYTYCDLYNADGSCAQSSTRNYKAERVITNPLSASSGLVLFTTYKPYTDVCSLGGKSFVWGLNYNTGGAPGTLAKGVALLQVSTGSIEQKDLSTAFKQNAQTNPDSKGDRRTGAMEGVSPQDQGLSYISPPKPVKRIIHMRER